MQASEVIKVVTGVGEPLSGRLFIFDALQFETRIFKIKRRSDNPLNGENPTITRLIDYEFFCGLKELKPVREITVEELLIWQSSGEQFQLIDVREQAEYESANMGALLIPLSTVSEKHYLISRDRKVVIHCRSGVRSARALRELEDKFGFDNLYNLKGGITEYLRVIETVAS
jgi:adenylyltransferase/sulfurtransferase